MQIVKKVLIGLLVIFIAIQFVRPAKNEQDTKMAEDITNLYTVPDDVHKVLVKACYDCHSNNTRYPWYANVQPVAWWLNDHIKDGKSELNFSEFGKRPLARQVKKLKEIAGEVEEHEMPLTSYTLVHRDADLTDAERELIVNWASGLRQHIAVQP